MRIFIGLGAAAALFLSTPSSAQEPRHGPPGGMPPGQGRLFVSPSGEVFRAGEGARPMQVWFDRADADHDGAITDAEMRADFARAFAGFDTDGDGEVEPDEVSRYETQILPEMGRFGFRPGGGAAFGPGMRRQGRLDRGRGGGRTGLRPRGGGGWAMMAGAARFGLLPIAHPIMDADVDFNRGITRAEYDAVAGRRFNQLKGWRQATARPNRPATAARASARGSRRSRTRRRRGCGSNRGRHRSGRRRSR